MAGLGTAAAANAAIDANMASGRATAGGVAPAPERSRRRSIQTDRKPSLWGGSWSWLPGGEVPRPHALQHNEEYKELIDDYMLRHKVKPGITGWAQINGWRGETDTLEKMQKRVEFDLFYIEHWSLWFDLKIIFLTLFKGFVGKNAY